ncbi:unknown [Sutterella sp. CAG:397]|nr:unknown [Sutterella sp. CAG:397]
MRISILARKPYFYYRESVYFYFATFNRHLDVVEFNHNLSEPIYFDNFFQIFLTYLESKCFSAFHIKCSIGRIVRIVTFFI